MDSRSRPYRFAKLNTSERSVRLIRLRHCSSTQIRCEISCHDLADCPPFTALSYAWGDAVEDRVIWLNGHRTYVRESLWQFLDQMRNAKDGRYFWIDALSIDQRSPDELIHQTRTMWQIYAQAELVHLWLGGGEEASDHAFEVISRPWVPLTPENYWANWLNPKLYPAPSVEDLQSVLSICQRIFWTRAWVLQELAYARDVEILCGTQRINWTVLHNFLSYIESMLDSSYGATYLPGIEDEAQWHETANAIHSSNAFWAITQKMRWKAHPEDFYTGPSLSLLLSCNQDMQSQDPRDCIYALLSLLRSPTNNERMRLLLRPDYSKSGLQLFADVLSYCLMSHDHIEGRALDYLIRRLALNPDDPRVVDMRTTYEYHIRVMETPMVESLIPINCRVPVPLEYMAKA